MVGVRRAMAILIAGLVLAAAGCGGDDAVERGNAYVEEVNAAQRQFAERMQRLSGRVTDTTSTTQDRRTLGAMADTVDEVVVELDGIDPPPAVADLHEELVGDMQAYAGEVRSATASMASDDVEDVLGAQQDVLAATETVQQEINQTIAAINQRLRDQA